MSVDLAHIRQVMAEADCLFNNDEVEAAIGRVAEAINRDLGETNPVVFCVMNGGLIFSASCSRCSTSPSNCPTCMRPVTATRPPAANCSGRPSRKSPSSTVTC